MVTVNQEGLNFLNITTNYLEQRNLCLLDKALDLTFLSITNHCSSLLYRIVSTTLTAEFFSRGFIVGLCTIIESIIHMFILKFVYNMVYNVWNAWYVFIVNFVKAILNYMYSN